MSGAGRTMRNTNILHSTIQLFCATVPSVMERSTAKKFDIGVLLYTHDRVEDAYINQEIIRNVWEKSGLFGSVKIVHAYNGKKSWYPKKYLEDALIRRSNPGHFQGAAELVDSGMSVFHSRFPKIPYVIALAADTWVLKPAYMSKFIRTMKQKNKWLACSPWDVPQVKDIPEVGISLDFFILDMLWDKRNHIFPLAYKQFYDQYADFILYVKGSNVSAEKLFFARYLRSCGKEFGREVGKRTYGLSKLLVFKERSPVHSHINKHGFWIRKHFWPKIGLLTHHDPGAKQKAFRTFPKFAGKHAEKFRTAKNVDYFNIHVPNRGENPG